MGLPLTHVTVHRDGAQLTRSGPLDVSEGEVQITGLPLILLSDSIRATCPDAQVLGLRLDLALTTEASLASPALDAALARARAQVAMLEARVEAQRHAREQLAELSIQPSDAARLQPEPVAISRWLQLDAALDHQLALADALLAEAELALAKAYQTAELATEAANQAQPGMDWRRWNPTLTATIRLAGAPSRVQLSLSYVVAAASWSPSYTVELNAAATEGRLVLRALVAQATGEPWQGVSLRLSTAQAHQPLAAPKLRALRFGAATAQPPSAWRPLPPDLDALFPELPAAPARASAKGNSAEPPEPSPALHMVRQADSAPPPAPSGPPPAAAPPPSAPKMAVMRSRSSAAPERSVARPKRAAPPPPSPPDQLLPPEGSLDYGRLILASYAASPGRRGTLLPADWAGIAAAKGAPSPAVQRVSQALGEHQRTAHRARYPDLPTHHVLPEPLDAADFTLDGEGLFDIADDGALHSVSLRSLRLKPSLHRLAVPKEDPRVFRIIDASLDAPMPLLPGPMDVLIDGALERSAPFAGQLGRSAVRVELGPDPAIQLVRNVRYREESAGMFRGKRRLVTEVEVKLASTLPEPVSVSLRARLPLAGSDDLVVEEGVSVPPAARWVGPDEGPELRGGRVQSVQLPAGGTATATHSYSVVLSTSAELQGGDRRG